MKILLRRILNLALYLSFCVMVGTGLLLAFRLLPGSRGGQGLQMLGWSRHDWGDMHTWISYLFIFLVVLHLGINWAWLSKVAAQGRPWRLILGLTIGLVLICGMMVIPIQHNGRGEHGGGGHKEHESEHHDSKH